MAYGTIMGQTSNPLLQNHINDKNNPHEVTTSQIGAATSTDLQNHIGNTSNPHKVTASQVGAPTTSQFNSHVNNKSNPHKVTAAQTGALPSTGGTLTGTLNMNGNKITGIPTATASGEPVEYSQLNLITQKTGFTYVGAKTYAETWNSAKYYRGNYDELESFIPIGYSTLSSKNTIFYLAVLTQNTILSPTFTYIYNNILYAKPCSLYNATVIYPTSGLIFNKSQGFVCSTPGYYVVAVEFD